MSAARSAYDYDLIVAGGGAAGFFGAITSAEAAPAARVLVLEKSSQVLGKVRISGGGRCNVTHACFDPRELARSYPRGERQLIGPFHRWGPADTVRWFEDRGVPLKTEADNRIFPQSDSSQSIIDCLTGGAAAAGVEVRTRTVAQAARPLPGGGHAVSLADGRTLTARRLLLTLGGTRNQIGAGLAAGYGHHVHPAAPSLFTFRIDDPRLGGLQGLSVGDVQVRIPHLKLSADGPVLITHWGLSGPGILRISAWGARELQACAYDFQVVLNWTGGRSAGEVVQRFDQLRGESPKRRIVNDPVGGIPARLWRRLVESVAPEGADELRWPHLPKPLARRLAEAATGCQFRVRGKSMNKDEFVTCGGVDLGEIDFKTMESRQAAGLHFAGEILDIDGITGGFNFQAAWTTGRLAGEAIARALES